jgi:hypothetical protein
MTEKINIKGKTITLIGKDQSEIDNKKIKFGLQVVNPVKKTRNPKGYTDSADITKAATINIIQEED